MRTTLLLLALTIASATPTIAQINLSWRNCITVTSGPNPGRVNLNSNCDGTIAGLPGTEYTLVVSFVAPPNITSFTGAKAVFEIYTQAPTLPDYWRHGIGECRETSYRAGFTDGLGTGTTGACQDPYNGAVTTREWTYTSSDPCADAATFSVQLTRESGRPLTAGQQYLANTVVFDTDHAADTGDGMCDGCFAPGNLEVTQLEIHQTAPLPTIVLTQPHTRKWAVWQGGNPFPPLCGDPVPTRNHTWGAIKATYR